MDYCRETTSTHPISLTYPQCLQDINSLIVDEGYLGLIPLFMYNETVLDLDDAEEFVAANENRDLAQSMDMAFGVTDKTSRKMVMAELKFRMENPNNLSREELEGKVAGSINILGNEIEIYNKYFVIVRQDQIEQARSRLARMFPPIDPNFIPSDIISLQGYYFT
jgi:hypothetical protein